MGAFTPPASVSVVIPCFRQAQFLAQAIESVLAQSHPAEVLVIDDGSPDNTAEVAARYPSVRYIRQENKGLAEARNLGFHSARGDYIVFLDADDCLTSHAIEKHLHCFSENPEAGFVVGDIDHIAADGSWIYSPRWPVLLGNFYQELLRVNHVANTIAVMFRRRVIETIGGFEKSCAPAEDYRLLLRAARLAASAHHSNVVAHYRRHQASSSRRGVRMLRAMRRVMRLEWTLVRGNAQLEAAHRQGQRYWRDHFGKVALREAFAHLGNGNYIKAATTFCGLLRYAGGQLLLFPWRYRRYGPLLIRRRLQAALQLRDNGRRPV